jgi:hypothetical protein
VFFFSNGSLVDHFLLAAAGTQEGEQVEFTTVSDSQGRLKADRVTGPMGSFVQGAPRRSFGDDQVGASLYGSGGKSYGSGNDGGGGKFNNDDDDSGFGGFDDEDKYGSK